MAGPGCGGSLKGLTSLLPLLLPLAAAEEEDEKNTQALGLTMFSAIFLVMGVFYLAHWRDHDIRKITWSTINQTLSIFCAVILFKNASEMGDLVFASAYRRTNLEERIFLNRGYTVFWYTCLFTSIYIVCAGLGKGKAWRKEVIARDGPMAATAEWSAEKPSFEQTKNTMHCCLFLAHTTGFAGLAGWGMKTNTAWFREDPWHCAVLIPEAMIWYWLIVTGLQLGRGWFVRRSGQVELEEGKEGKPPKADKLLALAEDELKDGEDDFFGLFMSYLIVTTLRFFIGGNLPNEEGEEGELVFKHTRFQVLTMYAMSAVFFFSAKHILNTKKEAMEKQEGAEEEKNKRMRKSAKVIVKEERSESSFAREEEEAEKEEEEEEEKELRPYMKKISKHLDESLLQIGGHQNLEFLRKELARVAARVVGLLVNTTSFTFAWTFMYATQWALAPFFDGEELILGIVLAILITILCCLLVYELDRLADEAEEMSTRDEDGTRRWTEQEDKVHRKLMESTGILIGFVWEQCFDVALAGIAPKGDVFLKPLLGLMTVLVIVPVWLWYIVPMEINSGYLLGILPPMINRRLTNIDLHAEPEVARTMERQVEAMLRVLKNKDEQMVDRILNKVRKYTPQGEKAATYEPPPLAAASAAPGPLSAPVGSVGMGASGGAGLA